jgi:hypothetical protein
MRVAAMVTMVGAALLAGCGGGGGGSSGKAQLRLLNAASGYSSLDLQLEGATVDKDKELAYGAVGEYVSVSDSGVATAITSSSNIYYNGTPSFSKDVKYTLVAFGSPGALKAAILAEDVDSPASNLSTLVVRHFAPDAEKVDLYLTSATTTDLSTASAIAKSVAGGGSTTLTSIKSGTYRLWVTGAGDLADVRLMADGLVLGSAQVSSLILTESTGGVLVNALQLVQGGAAVTPLLSNSQARVRVVSSLPTGTTLTAAAAGTTLAEGPIGNYTRVTGSGSATVVLTVNSTAVPMANQSLTAGGDFTLLVWGDPSSATGVQTRLVVDDNRLPLSSANAKIRLINLTYGTSAAYTLLTDSSTQTGTSNVAQGVASAYVNVAPAADMQLQVEPAGGGDAVFDTGSTGKPVIANSVWTVFVRGDSAAPVGLARSER